VIGIHIECELHAFTTLHIDCTTCAVAVVGHARDRWPGIRAVPMCSWVHRVPLPDGWIGRPILHHAMIAPGAHHFSRNTAGSAGNTQA
jgi:hypothetical protein